MRRSMILLALALAAAARADERQTTPAQKPKPPSTEEVLVAQLSSAKWMPAPALPGMPKGVEVAPIGVDPGSGGPTGYTRLPAGFHLPLHWHSHAEYTVLLSGKASFVVDGKQHELSPGSYVVIPAKARHELTCGTAAECVLLARRAGPTDYNFVNP